MGNGGKIEIYLDVSSFYSYVAFQQLQQNSHILSQHGVEVIIHPTSISGVVTSAQNSPPWAVPAKATQLDHDIRRVIRSTGLRSDPSLSPGELMMRGRTILPMRCLHYIRDRYDGYGEGEKTTYLTAFYGLFRSFWWDHRMLITEGEVGDVLRGIPEGLWLDSPGGFRGEEEEEEEDGGKKKEKKMLFTEEEVEEILKRGGGEEYGGKLRECVDEARGRGAYGAPWLWVTPPPSSRGMEMEGEPFFGSDRWHYVYELLGLPYTDVKLIPAAAAAAKAGR